MAGSLAFDRDAAEMRKANLKIEETKWTR